MEQWPHQQPTKVCIICENFKVYIAIAMGMQRRPEPTEITSRQKQMAEWEESTLYFFGPIKELISE